MSTKKKIVRWKYISPALSETLFKSLGTVNPNEMTWDTANMSTFCTKHNLDEKHIRDHFSRKKYQMKQDCKEFGYTLWNFEEVEDAKDAKKRKRPIPPQKSSIPSKKTPLVVIRPLINTNPSQQTLDPDKYRSNKWYGSEDDSSDENENSDSDDSFIDDAGELVENSRSLYEPSQEYEQPQESPKRTRAPDDDEIEPPTKIIAIPVPTLDERPLPTNVVVRYDEYDQNKILKKLCEKIVVRVTKEQVIDIADEIGYNHIHVYEFLSTKEGIPLSFEFKL